MIDLERLGAAIGRELDRGNVRVASEAYRAAIEIATGTTVSAVYANLIISGKSEVARLINEAY